MDASLGVLVIFLAGLIACNSQRCDNNRLRQCRTDVARQSERRVGDLSQRDCREFRENFDCLLDQTILCAHSDDREQNGREIVKAYRALQDNCDKEDGWKRNRCFISNEIIQCEERLPRRITDADSQTCRKYEEFRDCVENVMRGRSCTQSDRPYLKSYYVDIAHDLPWKCNVPTSSSPGYRPDSGYRPDDNYGGSYNNRNRSYDNDQRCCKSERCEDRDRLINCRQELLKIVEGRSNLASYSNTEKCRTYLNKFNCMLWHTYSCQQSYEKDTRTIEQSKSYIEKECNIDDDMARSTCFKETAMRDCDRYLQEETPSEKDVTCREYASYFDCFERQLRTCSYESELLQGFHLVMKVGEKAWTCSKKDKNQGAYTPYDPSNTYPYGGDPYGTTLTTDDENCKRRTSRDYHRCLVEKDKMEEEAKRTENSRERRIKTCCVVYSLRECTRQVVRQNCDRERSTVVNSLMGPQLKLRLDQCQDVNQSTCSASQMINNAIIIVLAVAIFRSIFEQ